MLDGSGYDLLFKPLSLFSLSDQTHVAIGARIVQADHCQH